MMSVSGTSEGMRLSAQQPSGGPAMHRVRDPRAHRCGLIPVEIGSQHFVRHAGKLFFVEVREKARHATATRVLKCLHPGCANGSGKLNCNGGWESIEEMEASHPAQKELERAGEAHPFGWFSEAPFVEETSTIDVNKLVAKAKTFVTKAEKALDEAKDDREFQSAYERHELATKQLNMLLAQQAAKKSGIVGLLIGAGDEVKAK
jgi:hypothetical protein